MATLMRADSLVEGHVFLQWMYNRIMRNNKNVLGAELGPTGSGKSYRDLRKVELWYKNYLKRPFPKENICFGVTTLMERLTSGELKKGDVLIFEEAGAGLGSLDFQNKVSKMFTYVLQSFRSMNIAIFFNLPYLSMLNKQARMLLHYSSESSGIDFERNVNNCKFFFHQVNQRTGKLYLKYPRIRYKGVVKTVKKLGWSMASPDLVDYYESQKAKYLAETTGEYLRQMREMKDKESIKGERNELTESQQEVYDLDQQELTQKEIAEKINKSISYVSYTMKVIEKKGFKVKKIRNYK